MALGDLQRCQGLCLGRRRQLFDRGFVELVDYDCQLIFFFEATKCIK
jgi:hypothetical protein